jgi:glycine cleavage system H protein
MTDTVRATRYYKRSRFVTHLPTDRLYTAAHYWLLEESAGVWRVGLTRFATRMLGEIVEFGLTVAPGDAIALGQTVGFLEGFKAMSDVYSTVDGELVGVSADLERDITLLESDPYGRGWLFRARGTPDPRRVDAEGYAAILDVTIDGMLASRHDLAADEEES